MIKKSYQQFKQDLGRNPDQVLIINEPICNLLAGFWSVLRECMLVEDKASYKTKEAIFATVSQTNECSHCVYNHQSAINEIYDKKTTNIIITGKNNVLDKEQMPPLINWALSNRSPNAQIITSPPFTQEEIPEIIGTAMLAHYTNRMVNIFIELPKTLARRKSLKMNLKRIVILLLKIPKKIIFYFKNKLKKEKKKHLQQGISLNILPDAELPNDLSWANSNPYIAGAFARFALAVEDAGQQYIAPKVRNLVNNYIQAWQGEEPGISRHWVEEAIVSLDKQDQPTARLALLTAIASYQVDQGVIDAFKVDHPEDRQLLAVTAWASWNAARRIGSWLAVANY
jgi:hypothetical protein